MPPNIVRLSTPNVNLPGRRRFVNTDRGQIDAQLQALRESQRFDAGQASQSRDLSLLVALLNNQNTQAQLTQRGELGRDQLTLSQEELGLSREQLGLTREQLDLSRRESESDRKFRDAEAKADRARDARLDTQNKALQERTLSLQEQIEQNRLAQVEGDARAQARLINIQEFEQFRGVLSDELNNTILTATNNAAGVGREIAATALRIDGEIADHAAEFMHAPESSMRASLQQYESNPVRNKDQVDGMISDLDSMVRHAVTTITNRGAPIQERMGAMTLLVGNSVGPGADGQAMPMIEAVFGYLERAKITAKENGDDSIVKRIEAKLKETEKVLGSMEAPAFAAFGEYRSAVQQQGTLTEVDREIQRFSGEAQRQKGEQVRERLARRDDQLLDDALGVSTEGPIDSFGGTQAVRPDFEGFAQDPDFTRLLGRLNLIPGGNSSPAPSRANSVVAGQRLIEDVASEAAAQREQTRIDAIRVPREARERQMTDEVVQLIRQMKAKGKSSVEIDRAVRQLSDLIRREQGMGLITG